MKYDIEVKPAPKDVWYTPQEARDYYGQYSRDGITVHWWGDGTGAENHDNIVTYFLNRRDGSVNYVVSDNKITKMVDPDNVAWTSQSGNPSTISIEFQPTLGDEGYKRGGWLIALLEHQYGRHLPLYPHNRWFNTACPGDISLARLRQEANKYNEGDDSMAEAEQKQIKFLQNVIDEREKRINTLQNEVNGLRETAHDYEDRINHLQDTVNQLGDTNVSAKLDLLIEEIKKLKEK